MTIAELRTERHERMKAELAKHKPETPGAKKGRPQHGKTIPIGRSRAYQDKERATAGVRLPLDF